MDARRHTDVDVVAVVVAADVAADLRGWCSIAEKRGPCERNGSWGWLEILFFGGRKEVRKVSNLIQEWASSSLG